MCAYVSLFCVIRLVIKLLIKPTIGHQGHCDASKHTNYCTISEYLTMYTLIDSVV